MIPRISPPPACPDSVGRWSGAAIVRPVSVVAGPERGGGRLEPTTRCTGWAIRCVESDDCCLDQRDRWYRLPGRLFWGAHRGAPCVVVPGPASASGCPISASRCPESPSRNPGSAPRPPGFLACRARHRSGVAVSPISASKAALLTSGRSGPTRSDRDVARAPPLGLVWPHA